MVYLSRCIAAILVLFFSLAGYAASSKNSGSECSDLDTVSVTSEGVSAAGVYFCRNFEWK